MYICAVVFHLVLYTAASALAISSLDNSISCAPAGILIAAGEDAQGPDPHGQDPHDEQHDQGLPSQQKDYSDRQNRQDPYGGQAPKGPNGT